MDRIAQAPQAERDALFREATVQLKWRNVRIVEKDYWVCWTLDQLFRIPGVSDHLVFKGGTSLSKVHGIIERFSEDIDVSLDPTKLGFAEILARDLSPSQLDKQWGRLGQACSEFAEREILPALQAASARIRELADAPGHGWRFQRDRKGFPELLFDYHPGGNRSCGLSIDRHGRHAARTSERAASRDYRERGLSETG
ncbi:MAG: nucleotidyl transferase AbiEii/AbiGii toxin family protein [Lacunisphaera sp.]|nr:nucleotidyl transferase AbiEii/AbiGii toxin family protein [Lacunisphaera sp.]